MASFAGISSPAAALLPAEVTALLSGDAQGSRLDVVIAHILEGCREIGTTIRNCGYSSDKVGTLNAFGDAQLDVDVKTDEVMFAALRASRCVHVAASEENPVEIACNGTGFSVAFDPLDGSSIVDANFAVGTIVGVWPGPGLLHRLGREQSAALIVQYGPRVTCALALSGSATVTGEAISLELTMRPEGWAVSIARLSISANAKTFAPGNLRATGDNEHYHRLVQFWITQKYTLRYSGGLVPDVYHILIKGEGVLANASSPLARAKLRLLFEAAPIALIIEAAGGASCVCASEAAEALAPTSILDVPISDLDRRVGVCYGSSTEVERFKAHIFA